MVTTYNPRINKAAVNSYTVWWTCFAAAFFVVSLFSATVAQATPVTIEFSGVFGGVSAPLATAAGGIFGTTDTFSGTLTYDTDVTDAQPLPDEGSYPFALTGFNVEVATQTVLYSVSLTASGNVVVFNDQPHDQILFVPGLVSGPSVPGTPGGNLASASMLLRDASGAVFIDDTIPQALTLAPFLAAGDLHFLRLNFLLDDNTLGIWSGTITVFVPEPATLLLAGLGLLGLLAHGHRRRRA